jgi:hypothetical protein
MNSYKDGDDKSNSNGWTDLNKEEKSDKSNEDKKSEGTIEKMKMNLQANYSNSNDNLIRNLNADLNNLESNKLL